MKNRIISLLHEGFSNRSIVAIVGCSSATVSYHAKKIGLNSKKRPTYDWNKIQKDIDLGLSVRECCQKYGFCKASYSKAVVSGKVIPKQRFAQLELIDMLLFCNGRRTTAYERKSIRKAMINHGLPYQCNMCGASKWMEKILTLEVDHIDGNPKNNVVKNLRLLCPNCHSTTDTWRGRNINRG